MRHTLKKTCKKREGSKRENKRNVYLCLLIFFPHRVFSPGRSCDPGASPQQGPTVDTEPEADLANILDFAPLPRSPQQDTQLTGRSEGDGVGSSVGKTVGISSRRTGIAQW